MESSESATRALQMSAMRRWPRVSKGMESSALIGYRGIANAMRRWPGVQMTQEPKSTFERVGGNMGYVSLLLY